ncbi:MAG: GNAT family N-acetyltransferase [Solirubrobacteraceae bacterium]
MERPDGLILVGDHVRLEPLALEHVPALVAAINEDPASFRFSTAPDTEAEMSAWVQDALAAREAGRELPFATYSSAQERIVGSTRFYDLERWLSPAGEPQRDRPPDACLIGYTWLGASAQRTACNTEAKLLMLSHAFEVWQVHRVAFRIDARNDRSRSAVERLGAKFEGVRRAERLGADGKVRDSAFYSILAAEWPAVKNGLISRLAPSRGEPYGTTTGTPA